ncbi:MAG: histidine triad nucleotide-binding protein [bacterium]|nr:histidine triad nucleotide-binding protein [bacterium]
MHLSDCIFCKIAKKELPADIVYESDRIVAFKDIKPVMPVHVLVIPKSHIPSVDNLEDKDRELLGELFLVASKIAREQGVAERGYRLVFNVGRDAGQTVDHLHLHLLGGRKLPFA